jgi:hypothetical protein
MIKHEFVFACDAVHQPNVVKLCGSFNNWDPNTAVLMKTAPGSRLYATTIDVAPTTQLFKFIVDGVWEVDDHQATVKDAAGNVNNVVTIESPSCQQSNSRAVKTRMSNNRKIDKGAQICDTYVVPAFDGSWDVDMKKAFAALRAFAESSALSWTSPTASTPKERAALHEMAEFFSFQHQSVGKALKTRCVLVTRKTRDEFAARDLPLPIPPPDPAFDNGRICCETQCVPLTLVLQTNRRFTKYCARLCSVIETNTFSSRKARNTGRKFICWRRHLNWRCVAVFVRATSFRVRFSA